MELGPSNLVAFPNDQTLVIFALTLPEIGMRLVAASRVEVDANSFELALEDVAFVRKRGLRVASLGLSSTWS